MNEDKTELSSREIELPQTPEIPWDQWFDKLRQQFIYWGWEEPQEVKEGEYPGFPILPHLPERYKDIDLPIFGSSFENIIAANKLLRKARGGDSIGTFYRPGLGANQIANEILEKIGAYKTMVITDPIYEGKEIIDWSRGILPVDLYARSLAAVGAGEMRVFLSKNQVSGGLVEVEDYTSVEIPAGGMAKIDCQVNGVNLFFYLLTEDMTKLDVMDFQVVSFGQPTPFHKSDESGGEEVADPRYDLDFQVKTVDRLPVGGVICFGHGFGYFPSQLPIEAYGFDAVYSEGGKIIAQKREDLGHRLEEAYKVAQLIKEAPSVLAAADPELTWEGYYKNVPKKRRGTLVDVIKVYQQRLDRISAFVNSLTDEDIREKTGRRVEFLLMNPIATKGVLAEDKVAHITDAPEDPDNPEDQKGFGPYFGNPTGLIKDHQRGNLNIFDYYGQLIEEFYNRFPQLRQTV